jgi:hypothetical protein
MSFSVDDIMKIVRVTSAVVSELDLIQIGCRHDGKVVGFDSEMAWGETSAVMFNLERDALMYDDTALTKKQIHTLIGIAHELELNYGEYEQFLKAV